jgi:FtsP/CotA-like multicopper oxidase with cupredoxin domain
MKHRGNVLLVTGGLVLAVVAGLAARPGAQAPGEVREVTLTAAPTMLRLASGQEVPGWAYNGQIPGPEIRVREGDRVRVTFKNDLPAATAIHWHGIDVPWTMDGVPGVTQAPVKPGETFVYEFVAKPAGTRFYHTHGSGQMDEALQMDLGLYGAFVIEARDEPRTDRDYTIVLSERSSTLDPRSGASRGADPHGAGHHGAGHHGAAPHGTGAPAAAHPASDVFLINGKSWPETPALRVQEGERVRLRLINAGSMAAHPMHLHGHSFRVVAIDGNRLDVPIKRDVITVNPGERYDIEFVADNPGVWLFHCHELHHADAGMMALIQYEGYEPGGRAAPAPGHGAGMRH